MFLFFGIVAVAGSYFVQVERWPWEAFALAVPGRAAGQPRSSSSTTCATSRPTAGRASGRSRCGSGASARARSYAAMVAVGFLVAAVAAWSPLGSLTARGCCCRWLTVPLAVRLVGVVRTRVDGPTLNGALARTGRLQLVFCVLLTAGILIA